MQYQVPQFIETEDKVVGPFSLRQFAYVGIAAVIAGISYFLVATWLFFIIAFIFIGGSLALAFVKINGRPLMKVGLNAFNFYWKPQTYIWKPDHPVMEQRRTAPAPVREMPPLESIASGSSLHKSWQNLQTGTPAAPEAKKTSDRQFIEKKMARALSDISAGKRRTRCRATRGLSLGIVRK